MIKAKLQQCNDAKLKGLYEIASCRVGNWIFYFMIKELLKKPSVRIAAATMVAIFSLAAAISGSLAWYAANSGMAVTGMAVSVKVSGSCGLAEMNLYKFEYGSTFYGDFETIDYLTPETGTVNLYDYNDEDNYFGVKSGDTWIKRVDAMNIYDPTDTVIRRISLKDVNCNAIYKITFEATGIESAHLVVSGSVLDDVTPLAGQILLSDCIDIDVFFPEDLLDSNASYIIEDDNATLDVNEYNDKAYYPSYKVRSWNRYHQWDGSDWVVTKEEPLSGTDKGSINYVDYLPPHEDSGNSSNPSVGDYYKVLYATAVPLHKYYKWNGSSWVISDEKPSGEGTTNQGSLEFLSDLPASSANSGDYYKVEFNLADLDPNEEVYYKLSYLSSLTNVHNHFYGPTDQDKSDEIVMVRNKAINFGGSTTYTVYVNVNYAPSKVNKYIDSISLSNIIALHDYSFLFEFLDSPRDFD